MDNEESKTETNGAVSATVTINRITKLLEGHTPRAQDRIMGFVQDTIGEQRREEADPRQSALPFGSPEA